MKKVTTVHIQGILFNIEEDAYSTLKESLFRHGKLGETQTESVLAGKFSILVSPQKQVITLEDVQTTLSEMGLKPAYVPGNTTGNPNDFKRMARNTNDKMLGGVCSGLGEYWDTDPTLIRVLFAVLFFGFGIGLLFYILLWIILPAKN